MSIESKHLCRIPVDRMACNSKSFTGIRKMLKWRTKQVLIVQSTVFDVEFYLLHMYCYNFLRSVSSTGSSLFAFKLSRPVTIHAGSALDF